MELLAIISAIVSTIALIVFFLMAGNIGALRRELQNKTYRDALIDYYTYRRLGEDQYGKAAEALLKAYYSQLILANSEWDKESMHKQLKNDIGSMFTAIGLDFPTIKLK